MAKRVMISVGNLIKMTALLYLEIATSALSLVPRLVHRPAPALMRAASVAIDAR